MNKKIRIGILLICIALVTIVFATDAPNFVHFTEGFCLSLGVVLSIKGGMEHRKEVVR